MVSAIPLIAFLVLLGKTIHEDFLKKNNYYQRHQDALELESVSALIYQLRQERGHAVGYVVSDGKEDQQELLSQYTQTDQAIQELKQTLTQQQKSLKWLNELATLPILRDKVNTIRLTASQVLDEYSAAIQSMINGEVNNLVLNAHDSEIRIRLTSYESLLHAGGSLGKLRGLIKKGAMGGSFSDNEFAQFCSLKGEFETYLSRSHRDTFGELRQSYEQTLRDPSVQQCKAMLESLYAQNTAEQTPISFSADSWWIHSTSYINVLRDLERLTLMEIKQISQDKLADVSRAMTRNLIIATGVILAIFLLLYDSIKSIVTAIVEIKLAADRITQGDVNLSLSVSSRDEIGSLAASFNQLIQVNREYVLAADRIGKGDYSSTIRIRSEADTLGISLNRMKTNLQELARENEKRTWLLTGSSELNDLMRGEKEVGELTQAVINHVAPYLKAQIGAIYIAKNSELMLAGTYAFHYRKENTSIIRPGQGFVGQAAEEKKPIIFTEVPDDYVKINSGLGNTSPKNIIVYPLFYEERVKGVIEIGAVREFGDLDLQFLKLVAENIGIAIHTSQSRTQMKELLQETQQQAEELETQQEELRQINEEMQEKTVLLERSEAELKAQQEELQQTNEELEEKAGLLEEQKERIETAKMEIETKARELEATSKYKSEFLANMSHELRTPLNSILILAKLLSENKNGALRDKDVEFAVNIYNSGTDLLNLINEILDLSKVEAGKIELEITAINPRVLMENMNAMFSEIARNKAIHCEFIANIKSDDFHLESDKQRLEQILRNLLSNAFKFTGHGGTVSLLVDQAPKSTEYRNPKLWRQEKVISFSVRDTGIGIQENKQNMIFEAFQQADGSTKRKYGGTGLGLSISRELAHALGGEIHLQSEEGKGTTFTLYLPLKFDHANLISQDKKVEVRKALAVNKPMPLRMEEPLKKDDNTLLSMPQATNDDRHAISENDKVILIIEDDIKFANVLMEFVRDRGYRAIIAHQGNIGLGLARKYRIDAIILDMKMPGMDGTEVLKHLKSNPDLRHIPVQIISGFDHKRVGIELGAFDFIMKPISQLDLQNAFERIEEFINNKLKRLLIVEDNHEQSKAIRELIGNGDVKSYSAYGGEEAYALLSKEKFDCVIIDLGLPDMSGFDLLEKIKDDARLNKIPIIVYTGRDLNKEETRRLEKLADSVILKTADSRERLLDETSLFLHRVEAQLSKEKQQMIRKLHRSDEVLKNKIVLIVEDDIRNIYSLTNVLEEEGMQCLTAENGKVALDMLKNQPHIDIILMDIMMPEMDGWETTQEIRKSPTFSKIPIIALTAKAMKGDREKCLEIGMSDYISKPIDIDRLLSLLRVWLYR